MKWNLPSTETRDEDMSDQSSPRDKNLFLRETDLEPAPNDSALAPPYDSYDVTGPGDADAVSDCTRISFEADKSEQDPDEGALIVVPDQQDALDDEASVNNALQPASPESEAVRQISVALPGSKRWMHTLPIYREPRKSRNDWKRNWSVSGLTKSSVCLARPNLLQGIHFD